MNHEPICKSLLVGVSDHWLVNFVICESDPDGCARRTQGFILVWVEYPYVQFEAARVTGTVCSRGYKWAREGEGPKSLIEGSNGVESS